MLKHSTLRLYQRPLINGRSFFISHIHFISAFVQRDLDIDVQEVNVDGVQASRRFEVGMRLFNTGTTEVTSV